MLPLGLKRSKVDRRMWQCRTGQDRMRVMGITALKYPSGNDHYLCHFVDAVSFPGPLTCTSKSIRKESKPS
jgi:hypothetical protein